MGRRPATSPAGQIRKRHLLLWRGLIWAVSVALFLCLPNPLIGLAALAALLLIDYGAHRIGSLRKTRYQVATLNEILAQADIVEFYKDQTAADKDIGELGGPQGDAPYNLVHAVRAERIKWFVQRFRLQGRRVLDIGCGRGNNTLHFLDSDNTAVGMDLQPSLIADFRSRTESPAVMGDACCLPFRDQCFDVVCFSEVIEHLEKPQDALNEIARVVKPGGFIIVSIPYRERIEETLCIHCNRKTPVNAHLHSFDKEIMERMLTDAGFVVQKFVTFTSRPAERLGMAGVTFFLPFFIWYFLDAVLCRLFGRESFMAVRAVRCD